MTNSIRTPRQGSTQWSRRIAKAVDDEQWQSFRLTLKGKSTTQKLRMLKDYFAENMESIDHKTPVGGEMDEETKKWYEDVSIRVDNYIKALSRGGQLYPGESLHTMLKHDWKPRVKKD